MIRNALRHDRSPTLSVHRTIFSSGDAVEMNLKIRQASKPAEELESTSFVVWDYNRSALAINERNTVYEYKYAPKHQPAPFQGQVRWSPGFIACTRTPMFKAFARSQ